MFSLRKKTETVELAPNVHLWSAFAGACRFRDESPPLFAEFELPDLPLVEIEESDTVVLVLDEQEHERGEFLTCLTVNTCDAFGHPAVYVKSYPAELVGRDELLQWARENIRPTMMHRDLLLAGFRFESYGAELVPGRWA